MKNVYRKKMSIESIKEIPLKFEWKENKNKLKEMRRARYNK